MDTLQTTDLSVLREEEKDLLQQIQQSQKLIESAVLENASLQQQLVELYQIHSDSQKEFQQLLQEYSLSKKKNQETIEQYESSLTALQTTISVLQQSNTRIQQQQQQQDFSSNTTIQLAPMTREPSFRLEPLSYFYFLFLFALLALLESYT